MNSTNIPSHEELLAGLDNGSIKTEAIVRRGIWPFRKTRAILRMGAGFDGDAFVLLMNERTRAGIELTRAVLRSFYAWPQTHSIATTVKSMVVARQITDDTALLFIHDYRLLRPMVGAA